MWIKSYSFTAPSVGLLIRYFLPTKNTMITGIEQIQEQAINSPQSVSSRREPLNILKPTANVLILSVLVTISGHIKLFQLVTNVNTARVAIAGIAHGKATLKNVWAGLQPSSFEASSNSFEKVKKYWRIKNTPNPPKIAGTINAW